MTTQQTRNVLEDPGFAWWFAQNQWMLDIAREMVRHGPDFDPRLSGLRYPCGAGPVTTRKLRVLMKAVARRGGFTEEPLSEAYSSPKTGRSYWKDGRHRIAYRLAIGLPPIARYQNSSIFVKSRQHDIS